MRAFQRYQAQFVGYIRNPTPNNLPDGVARRGMRLYREIVFNNMEATLAACFPVCKRILGARRWPRTVRAFLAEHRCTTPLFHQIPEEFLRWLQSGAASCATLPPFFQALAHYEWVELAVAIADVTSPPVEAEGDLLQGRPVLAPSLMLLEYRYPVHRISPKFRPRAPDAVPTRLLVFRDAADAVHFVEVNPVMARLVQLMQEGGRTGREILETIADELQHPDAGVILQCGTAVLHDLKRQGAILGVAL